MSPPLLCESMVDFRAQPQGTTTTLQPVERDLGQIGRAWEENRSNLNVIESQPTELS